MKKLAIFVEGQTELIFVEKLLLEIGNRRKISIKKQELKGGSSCPFISILKGEIPVTKDTEYRVLLYCSCNDEKVLSDIRERYVNLKGRGYETIIGLRDLYPKSYSDRERVRNSIERALIGFDSVRMVLAVMEIETWFIAELTHYARLSPGLTLDLIRSSVINLENIRNFEEEIEHPSHILNRIYKLVGFAYGKRKNQVERTVFNLDYEELYISLREKINGLKEFLNCLDNFFS